MSGLSKPFLRSSVSSVLDSMPPEERKNKSDRIFQKVASTEHYHLAKETESLMIYLHFDSEVQTVPQFCAAPDYGMPIVVPFCYNNEIVPVKVFSFDELQVGVFGILEPKLSIRSQAERLIEPEKLRCVLVPGLAFDEQCRRLGRGKGYYDRLLKRIQLKRLPPQCVSIGLAFECQLVSEVPVNDSDIPVLMVITEERLIKSRP
ncbi:MAG: 5-formyltetrahydrofolate cyclo-ligase [Planctomycetaceae bacterium]|nr:5-formyltetrahydrofolate cyclo-ligase [Planctomycetaceae bacterium]